MIVRDASRNRRSALWLALVLLVLQLGFAPNIGILGGRANLALVFVGCTCLGGDARRAPVYGFVAGALYDLSGTGPLGLMALVLTLAGWALASLDRPSPADDLAGSLVLFVPLALGVALLCALVLLALGSSTFVDLVFMRALPGAVLDCLCFVAASKLLERLGGGGSQGLNLGGKGHGGRRGGHYTMGRGLSR